MNPFLTPPPARSCNPILAYQPTASSLTKLTDFSISQLNTLQHDAHELFPLEDNIHVERISKPTLYYKAPEQEILTSRREVRQKVHDMVQQKLALIRTAPNDRFYGEDTLLYEELMLESIRYMRQLQQRRIKSLERSMEIRREAQWTEAGEKLKELGKQEPFNPNSLEALLSGRAPVRRERQGPEEPREVRQVRFGAAPEVERKKPYTSQTELKIVEYGAEEGVRARR